MLTEHRIWWSGRRICWAGRKVVWRVFFHDKARYDIKTTSCILTTESDYWTFGNCPYLLCLVKNEGGSWTSYFQWFRCNNGLTFWNCKNYIRILKNTEAPKYVWEKFIKSVSFYLKRNMRVKMKNVLLWFSMMLFLSCKTMSVPELLYCIFQLFRFGSLEIRMH